MTEVIGKVDFVTDSINSLVLNRKVKKLKYFYIFELVTFSLTPLISLTKE
jgi:hypothetical protein